MLIFKLQYEMAVLVIFVFMFYVRMTEWAKEETLILIQQIRNSNVWSTKSKEYKDANVCSDIFLRNWPFFQLENMEIKGKWHDMKTKLVDNWPKIGGGDVLHKICFVYSYMVFFQQFESSKEYISR